MSFTDDAPVILYGSNISYFTGKMETYFRIRGIPYQLRAMQFPRDEQRFKRALGLNQMPVVELPDGRLMTDTTAMIQWFEAAHGGPAVVPADPVQRFFALLLEDYADEWFWRPAMHYRWYYPQGAALQAWHLASEVMAEYPAPFWLRRAVVRRRQRKGYTAGDGVSEANRAGVEALYLDLLDHLEAIFSVRPFLLGQQPGLADVGFSGPFFRHFALDPVPLAILRERAPAVLEWVARLWNSTPDRRPADVVGEEAGATSAGLPADLDPLFADIGRVYLPYLNANCTAVAAGKRRFDTEVGGVQYRNARASHYRVWCLARLREAFDSLPEAARGTVRERLEATGCWQPLWAVASLPMQPDQEAGLPFRADAKMLAVNE